MSILKKLKEHNKKEKASFHMPGHKSGAAFNGSFLKSDIWKLDTTELSDTDCLLSPKEFIKEAEERAARAYGSEKSFFLVNGASCGILAMFYSAFKEGDKVIVFRDCHQSVINAMVLTGAQPIYAEPVYHEKGFSGGAEVREVIEKLTENPDARGVFITSPTYFGIASDINEIARAAHEKGALLLCDEAHGAHFPFSEAFPESAVASGADMSVVSLHKSMPSPNQTAVLNLGKCSVSPESVKNSINMFQSTSPSYIFLSAMDYAVSVGENFGEIKTEQVLKSMTKSEHLYSFDDPFKQILDFTDRGYDGYEVAEILEKQFGIFAELATKSCVLLMISWGNEQKDFLLLKRAIKYLEALPPKKRIEPEELSISASELVLSPKETSKREKEIISLYCAEGRIAASEITIFPPCIPLVMSGERIKKEHVEKISGAIKKKLIITGMEDESVCVVKE